MSASLAQGKQVLELFSGASSQQVQQFIEAGDLVNMMLIQDLHQVDRGEFTRVLAHAGQLPDTGYVPDRFTSPAEQVSHLLQWNREFGLGFTEDQIVAAEAAVPAFAGDRPLVALTLCWTLGTLEKTVNAKLTIMRHVYGEDKVFVSPSFKTEAEHTSLVEGAPEFVPNHIWWQVIDLGASRDKAPDQVPAATAAGIEVFDVACQHPVYVRQHNGDDTPYLGIPGIRVEVKLQAKSGPCAPYVHGYSIGYVEVGVRWADETDSNYATPVRM